jgi:hypothetical protein
MTGRALVLDADSRTALAAVRALGRAGYEVGTMTTFGDALASHSRWAVRHHVPFTDRTLGASIDALADEHGYEVALAAKEFTLAALLDHPPRTPTVPTLGRPLVLLSDKLELAGVAERAGVRYPATGVVGQDEALSYPLMVKSSRSAVAGADGRVVDWSGAKVAQGARELEDVAERIRAKGLTPIFQPRVERVDKVNVTIVRRDGECDVRFPYRVLRDVPLTGGIAVSLETLPAAEGIGRDAVDALDRVCAAAGYDGVANGEFCVARDGSLTLIEVNTRLWGSLWFAERLGQRVTERCVRLALGLPRLPAAPPAGRNRYHNVAGELRWARLHPTPVRRTAEVLASLRPWHVFEYVDVRDLGALGWVGIGKARTLARRGR